MREEYDIAISEAVTDELSPPNFSYSHDALALIVEDSRRVRRTISERFAHDAEGYIDYLQKKAWDIRPSGYRGPPFRTAAKYRKSHASQDLACGC